MSVLEDCEEIRQLLARYHHLGDALDSAAFAECFTEDGVIDANGVRTVGREAIGGTCDAYRPVYAARPMRHVTANILIEVDGDEAQSSSYVVLLATGEQPGVIGTGTYRDRLRRVEGRWMIAERVIVSDGGPRVAPPTDVE